MSIAKREASDAAVCAAITRHHARTFTAASRFLPAEKRRAAFAIYAFCRVADDFVDEAHDQDVRVAGARLDHHREQLHAALRGQATTPVFRELRWTIERYQIPLAPFDALLAMLREDLAPVTYSDWPQVERYCEGVASTVGEMCAFVFGLPEAPVLRCEALRCARTLGVALQLTNILRDVGEDAGRGRCYLPEDELAMFNISRQAILSRQVSPSDENWRRFMQFQIARGRALYDEAEPGIRMLDPDAQCCASICSAGYAGILGAIERRGYDSLTGRSRLGALRKISILFRAWMTFRREESRGRGVRHHAVSGSALGTGR